MQRKLILIFGKSGSGKTFLAKRIIEQFPRVIIFDKLHEYDGDVATSFQEFLELEPDARSSYVISCRYLFDDLDEIQLHYDYTARAVWEFGNCLLVIEECEQFIDSYASNSNPINHLVSVGRHHGVSLLAIGRRPFEIAVKIRTQFTSIVTFKQTEPNDLRYLASYGFDADAVSRLSFDEHEYLVYGEPIDDMLAQTPDSLY